MLDISLVASDLDGTLLSPDHQLQPQLLRAIESFRLHGGIFTIATGRPYQTALPFIRQLNIDVPVILCNGAVIMEKEQLILQQSFQAASLQRLIEDAYAKGLQVFMFSHLDVYVFAKHAETEAYEHKENITCKMMDYHSTAWKSLYIEKVILIGSVELARRLWEQHAEETKHFQAFQSEVNYLEIVDRACSKGTAIQQVSQRLNISRERIMSIGNELNDLPMFEASAIGVAVANANSQLKQAASYICNNAYGEGVLEAIERLLTQTHSRKRGI